MRHQRGNILFLILLAIVLFAALSYAVTNGTRVSDNGGMSNEAAESAAGDMLNWFAEIDLAVQRLRVIKGYPVEQINFRDNNNKDQIDGADIFNNTACPSTDCRVFYTDGGGVTSRFFEKYADPAADQNNSNNRIPGHHTYLAARVDHIGTPNNDVVARIDSIKLPICKAVNRKLGLPECPAANTTGSAKRFQGNASEIATALADSGAYFFSGDVKGKVTFCICGGLTDTVGSLYHVVMER